MAIAGRRETGKHFCHSSSCCWKSYKGVRLISIEVNVLVIKSNHLSHDEVTVDVDRDVSTYQLPCTAVIGLFFILVIGALEEMSPICVAWLHNTCVFVFSFLTSKINIPPFTLNVVECTLKWITSFTIRKLYFVPKQEVSAVLGVLWNSGSLCLSVSNVLLSYS